MKWHTNVSIGDLHYLRSKFAQSQGLDNIRLQSFIRATEVFYRSHQFRVNGDYFLTWAFLTPEMEVNYNLNKMDWLDSTSEGRPWIVEAYMPENASSAMRELRHLIPGKILRFRLGEYRIRSIRLP